MNEENKINKEVESKNVSLDNEEVESKILTQADIDKAVNNAVQKTSEERKKDREEIEALKQTIEAQNLTAEEIAQKREEEARSEEQKKYSNLERENKSFFTEKLLAKHGLPITPEIVNSYVALSKEAIENSIVGQAQVIKDATQRKAEQLAEQNAPVQTFKETSSKEEKGPWII